MRNSRYGNPYSHPAPGGGPVETRGRAVSLSLAAGVLKYRQDICRTPCRSKPLAYGTIVKKFGNRSKGPKVGLELIFWHDKQNHEPDRSVIECVEFNARRGATESGYHLVDAIG